jgi:hypothetical protein
MTHAPRESRELPRATRTKGHRALSLAAGFSVIGVFAGLSCGGTTGREDLPAPATDDGGVTGADGTTESSVVETPTATATDAGTGDAGSLDATLVGNASAQELDGSTFDVIILYSDRVLPAIGATAPSGTDAGEAGYPWPDCPPFIRLSHQGQVLTTGGMDAVELPAAIDDAGMVIRAPAGSACARYGWLGSVAADICFDGTVVPRPEGGCPAGVISSTVADECLVTSGAGDLGFIALPPCNWAIEAGAVGVGPGAGRSRYAVCLDLYACMLRTKCSSHPTSSKDPIQSTNSCLCGTANSMACLNDASGPCATEELAALEEPATASGVGLALGSYEQTGNLAGTTGASAAGFTGYSGAKLNDVMAAVVGAYPVNCFDLDAGAP